MKIRLPFPCLLLALGLGTAVAASAATDTDTSTWSDADFFGVWTGTAWSTSQPGVFDYTQFQSMGTAGDVQGAVKANDYVTAKSRLQYYMAHRTGIPVAPIALNAATSDIRENPDGVSLDDTTNDRAHTFWFYDPVNQLVNINVPGGSDSLTTPYGNIDWVDTPLEADGVTPCDSKWTSQLSRFDFMGQMVSRYLGEMTTAGADDTDHDIDNLMSMVADYIRDEGNSSGGPGWGLGLQAAIRLLAWSQNYPEICTVTVAGPNRTTAMLKHMYQIADYTSNGANFYGIAINIGLTQSHALEQFATYYPEFKNSPQWLGTALAWASLYPPANVRNDGVLAEPATGYHRGQIYQLQSTQAFAVGNGVSIFSPPSEEEILDRMLTFSADVSVPKLLANCSDGNGEMFQIGDSNVEGDFAKLASAGNLQDPQRLDVQYVTQRSGALYPPGHTSSVYYHGAAVLRNGWSANSVVAFLENQPPGNHAHPDGLSLNLYAYGDQLLLNSGKVTYDRSDSVGDWVARETQANSTVQIDGRPMLNSQQQISSWTSQPGFDLVVGQYSDAEAPGLPPVNDTMVEQSAPGANFGTQHTLDISGNSTGHKTAYLQFRPGRIVSSTVAASTKLAFQCTACPSDAGTNPVTVYVYGIHQDTTAQLWTLWNESSITWSSNPFPKASNGDLDTTDSSVTLLGTLTITGTAEYDLSSSTLASWIAGEIGPSGNAAGLLNIAVLETTNRPCSFSSREGSTWPSLQIAVGSGSGTPWGELITHQRTVYFDRTNTFIVSDALTGQSKAHQFDQLWNLNTNISNPTTAPTPNSSTGIASVQFLQGSSTLATLNIVPADAGSLTKQALEGRMARDQTTPVPANWRIDYGKQASSNTAFDTVLNPVSPGAPSSQTVSSVTRLAITGITDNSKATALQLTYGDASTLTYYSYHSLSGLGITRTFSNSFGTLSTDGTMTAIRAGASSSLSNVSSIAVRRTSSLVCGSTTLVSASAKLKDLCVAYPTSGEVDVTSDAPVTQTISVYTPWSSTTTVTLNGRTLDSTLYSQSGSLLTIPVYLLFDGGVTNASITSGRINFPASTWGFYDLSGRTVLESGTNAHNNLAYFGNAWSDSIVEANVQISEVDDNSNRLGVISRYSTTTGNFYGFVWDRDTTVAEGGKLRIQLWNSGAMTSLAVKNFAMHVGSDYRFKGVLKTDGSGNLTLTFYVNGAQQLTATVLATASPAPLPAGYSGLIADYAHMFFDQVYVTSDTSQTAVAAESQVVATIHPTGEGHTGTNAPYSNEFAQGSKVLAVQLDPTLGTPSDYAYLKFAFSDTGLSTGPAVTSAKLRIYAYVADWSYTGLPVLVNVYGLPDTSWNTRQITWNNHPSDTGLGSSIASFSAVAQEPQWFEMDVTAWVNANRTNSEMAFKLVPTSTTSVEMYSTIFALQPELVITK